jgi:catechol 2,3-dioxygenase-like lactoylglutathione lyase family enzyme
MSSTQMNKEIETKLEVVILPVSDIERSKRFYERLGWRLDADFSSAAHWRVVQQTPPGSQCSVHFGTGLTSAAPGSIPPLYLVVSDIEAARALLISQGADVGEVFHFAAVGGPRMPGRHPEGRPYSSHAAFKDPDGNTWLLQEVKARLAGRGLSLDLPTLKDLLLEAEKRHGEYTATAPKHHWSGWYAAYVLAREQGKSPEQAVKAGALHIEEQQPI